jgi:hypothetical protein
VNGEHVAVGKPGTYQPVERVWHDGDTVSFTLPMTFRLALYTGVDEPGWGDRYALLYGPVLMAAVGPLKEVGHVGSTIGLPLPAERIIESLTPIDGKPLHFAIDGDPDHVYMPYWQVMAETFSVLPVVAV